MSFVENKPPIDPVKLQSIKYRGVLYYNINIIKKLILGIPLCKESMSYKVIETKRMATP